MKGLASKHKMATETPPPYFPQGSLAPPDEKRYRKFKLFVFGAITVLALLLIGFIAGAVYVIRWWMA